MGLFNKISEDRSPPGLERKLLRWTPRALVISVAGPVALSFVARLVISGDSDASKTIATIDIFSIALAITLLTAVFTVAIGSFIVYVMKGPGYVADAYPLDDAAEPDTSSRKGKAPK